MTRPHRIDVPVPDGVPGAPTITWLAANAQQQEQTYVKFPDGTRVAVWADGTVKVGRESDEPIDIHIDPPTVRGPGKGLKGRPATAFTKIRWSAKP